MGTLRPRRSGSPAVFFMHLRLKTLHFYLDSAANKCTALPALGHLCGVFWWGDCSINAVGIEKNGKVCPSIAIIKKNMYLC